MHPAGSRLAFPPLPPSVATLDSRRGFLCLPVSIFIDISLPCFPYESLLRL